ncbi:MAG: hypothetical protein K6A30_07690 [Lachnospiraceae bacterium]|nr:hypothetical protein [Lachnospiraceae bacterium]
MKEILKRLPVIEKKKPSERVKRTTYPEKKSFRDAIRDAIDQILKEVSVKEYDKLLYKLEVAGYEIKRRKHISLKGKDLSAEYAEILAEKKKLYGEYRQVKKDMQEIQRAKYDIDQFLKSDEEQKKERVRKHNITR